VLLRSLVLGATHAGMWQSDQQLSANDIADALLLGVGRRGDD
jgi:hypothetical protein